MGYYLFAILPNINAGMVFLFGIFTVLVLILSIALTVFIEDSDCDNYKFLIKCAKWLYPVYACIFLLTVFIPSQKQMAFIIAAPYIVENQQLQEAGQNSAEIIKLGTEYVKDILTTATAAKGK